MSDELCRVETLQDELISTQQKAIAHAAELARLRAERDEAVAKSRIDERQCDEMTAKYGEALVERDTLRAEVERLKAENATIREVADDVVSDAQMLYHSADLAGDGETAGKAALRLLRERAETAEHQRDAATRRAEMLARLCRAWANSPVGSRVRSCYEGDGFDELRAARRAVDAAGAMGGA